MTTLTGPQLANQALLLYVEGGHETATFLDKIEEFDRTETEAEEAEEFDALDALEDSLAMPEGMNLREMSMGVIVRNA